MESIEEIDAAVVNMNKNKNKSNRRSDANFNKNNIKDNRSQKSQEGTKSENNYLPNNSSHVKQEEPVRKIFDSDEEVESLGE